MAEVLAPLRPIGVVHSPYRERKDAPRQGRHRSDESSLEIFEAYEPGLRDIERCTHLIALYWMHGGDRERLQTRTPWGPEVHGVFATRSPNRPNPLGFCVVDLLERKGRVLRVRGLDALDGSCRTFQSLWCKKLKKHVTKNSPCEDRFGKRRPTTGF